MSILDSLAGTESGGNFGARNAETGSSGRAGHFGRLQFGRDRMDDAVRAGVLPAGITPQQFLASPELQQRTEQWHLSDMAQQAERMGLTRYIGQNVGGVPITMDSILAMGHLGGMGGARRYLESGGQYNPADSFGTSLSDYAARHGSASGGATSTQAAQAPDQAPQNAMSQIDQRRQMAQQMMTQFGPRTNALSAEAFQRQTPQRNAMAQFNLGPAQNQFMR